jgi:hypothetical protein
VRAVELTCVLEHRDGVPYLRMGDSTVEHQRLP